MQRYIIRSDLKPRKMWIKIRDEHYRIWSVSITELCSEWLERQLLFVSSWGWFGCRKWMVHKRRGPAPWTQKLLCNCIYKYCM